MEVQGEMHFKGSDVDDDKKTSDARHILVTIEMNIHVDVPC